MLLEEMKSCIYMALELAFLHVNWSSYARQKCIALWEQDLMPIAVPYGFSFST